MARKPSLVKVIPKRKTLPRVDARDLEKKLLARLVKKTQGVVKDKVAKKIQNLIREGYELAVKGRQNRGDILVTVEFGEVKRDKKVKSWLEGEKVVLEVPEGWYFRLGKALQPNVEVRESEEVKGVSAQKSRIREQLSKAVWTVVTRSKAFSEAVRGETRILTEFLSLGHGTRRRF